MKFSAKCVCGSQMFEVFTLPKLPVCKPEAKPVDQQFLHCTRCGHGKLGTVVPPETLYDGYAATSASAGSTAGVVNFAAFVKKHCGDFDIVVDIGGNDGSLVALFEGDSVCIDPNTSSGIRDYIENVDLGFLNGEKKLILSSHTLEHIDDPEKVFAKLAEVMDAGDIGAFQFPSLERLISDCRIDQIYHEHIHYYSLRSVSTLLAKYGFEITAHDFDPMHYGALQIVFRKGTPSVQGEVIEKKSIIRANLMFRNAAWALNDRLEKLEPIGYGASQMLPLLLYHLPALHRLKYIMDEDAAKHGSYHGFEVRPVEDVEGKTVMVTAFNTKMAVRKIAAKLFAANAAEVIVPFNFL